MNYALNYTYAFRIKIAYNHSMNSSAILLMNTISSIKLEYNLKL